ncbi:MAG TPA: hypothetical protein VK911_08240 [Vicinamibacterales bacterium]|nr:hypothetical protein [Vicinamibacterales bacterium]
MVLTDQRLLFGGARPSGAERDGGRVLESGSIPLHELSRSVLSTAEEGKAPHDHGVNVIVTAHGLRIFLPVPSREEAVRLQRVLAELLP